MKKILPCVIGLGYVGLPVFISLKKKFKVVGFDTSKKRVVNLNNLIDTNREFIKNDLIIKNKSIITDNPEKIGECSYDCVQKPSTWISNELLISFMGIEIETRITTSSMSRFINGESKS